MTEPQHYQLSRHEFIDLNSNKPGGYAFVLNFYKGISEDNIIKSVNARDLYLTLKSSNRAVELSEDGRFSFVFSKDFLLQISYEHRAIEEESEGDDSQDTEQQETA